MRSFERDQTMKERSFERASAMQFRTNPHEGFNMIIKE